MFVCLIFMSCFDIILFLCLYYVLWLFACLLFGSIFVCSLGRNSFVYLHVCQSICLLIFRYTILLNGKTAIHEALVKKSSDFADREPVNIIKVLESTGQFGGEQYSRLAYIHNSRNRNNLTG